MATPAGATFEERALEDLLPRILAIAKAGLQLIQSRNRADEVGVDVVSPAPRKFFLKKCDPAIETNRRQTPTDQRRPQRAQPFDSAIGPFVALELLRPLVPLEHEWRSIGVPSEVRPVEAAITGVAKRELPAGLVQTAADLIGRHDGESSRAMLRQRWLLAHVSSANAALSSPIAWRSVMN